MVIPLRRIARPLCSESTFLRRQLECVAKLPAARPVEVCTSLEHTRHLADDVASADECRRAVALAQGAMRICCDDDGDGSRLFPPHVPEAVPLLGDSGSALFAKLSERVKDRVCEQFGPVEHVNSLISWISGSAAELGAAGIDDPTPRSFDAERDALQGTFAPHVDKANQPTYDVSALLYLTTAGIDFRGGYFAFNDADRDRLIQPKAGRLLAFTSGFENLHQVRPVRCGERLVLSIWFRRNDPQGGLPDDQTV